MRSHRRGVVHCLLGGQTHSLAAETDDSVKLTNFAAAVAPGNAPLPAATADAQVSRALMSPEQTGRIRRSVDRRSDLYSLGVLFYRLLTGRKPLEARNALEWVHAHLAREPCAPERIVPTFARPIADIVLKLLAKSPEDRYQSPGDASRSDVSKVPSDAATSPSVFAKLPSDAATLPSVFPSCRATRQTWQSVFARLPSDAETLQSVFATLPSDADKVAERLCDSGKRRWEVAKRLCEAAERRFNVAKQRVEVEKRLGRFAKRRLLCAERRGDSSERAGVRRATRRRGNAAFPIRRATFAIRRATFGLRKVAPALGGAGRTVLRAPFRGGFRCLYPIQARRGRFGFTGTVDFRKRPARPRPLPVRRDRRPIATSVTPRLSLMTRSARRVGCSHA